MTAPRRGGPFPVELAEGDDWSTWALTTAQLDTLRTRAEKIVDIQPAERGSEGWRWRLKAKRTVGTVRFGSGEDAVQLRITPKVPVDRLLHLLAHAPDRARWDHGLVDTAAREELFPAVARTFVRTAERALRPGPLSGYQGREDTSTTLRGRLRVAAQLRRRPGLALPLEVAYDEHTPDILENRLLLGAARRLARLPGLEPSVRSRLCGLDVLLDGVTAPAPGARLPVWTPTRLNARYGPALRLAELVLRGASFEYADGRRVRVDGLLLNMEKVYEDFLAAALGAVLQRRAGGRPQPHPRTHHLDDRREHVLLPDLVHLLPDDGGALRPAVVVDAKYQEGLRRENLYQMLAYCTRFGLHEGHLICVAGDVDGTAVRVPAPGGTITLHRHVLDLSLPRQALTARLDDLGRTILRARTPAARPGA
ncbi:McrC family protein [Streptomyces pini]|uniref:5-methylcytosine-specific restriction enzyme subunit McrC n=1 Tax=Streptomyces pini TaxID=1520580 RepID=A0A1I3Z5U5_9ACTN|nr:hypothetical protein [Streptomyces pini]SFK38936.1 5-methylcytosine-specific restriction enzyme subunit McrC [Streptomyces pini]